ncbi:hypothetical protein CANINC_000007 [Pichia inconspicua]|uniref:Uncharacterized protein n=1 Tax=Pichia inconspicua TaxID=52247 RepID=A0A4T0X769_9ASCO|nr:hypothetical protein CANINC_000007 [[Candida] inconspicua]
MARPGAIYRMSQQKTQLKLEYKFPILDVQELVQLYVTMGFEVNEVVLNRPTTTFMKTLIEQIMDKFLYISPYVLKEKVSQMEFNSYDENMEHDNDLDQDNKSTNNIKNSISIIACQRIMYKFLCDCGVDDFSIRDILKPDATRLQIILSALINYARFREERMGDLDDLIDNSDETLERYKDLIRMNQELQKEIDKVEKELNSQKYSLDTLHNENENLEGQLQSLKSIQKQLTQDYEKYKSEKQELKKELENQSALYVALENDLNEIKPYIKESPESIKELIQRMKDSEMKESKSLELAEEKLKKITTSLDSFNLLIQELNNITGYLDELKTTSSRNKVLEDKMKDLQVKLSEKSEQTNDYQRKITQISRQLELNKESIEKHRSVYSEKKRKLQDRIETQIREFAETKAAFNLEGLELTEKEAQINNWNMELLQFNRQFEFECKETGFEFEKLHSKVNLYINEIKQKISESKKLIEQ